MMADYETELHALNNFAHDLRRRHHRLPKDAQPIASNIIAQVDELPPHVIPYLTPDWAVQQREKLLPMIRLQMLEFRSRLAGGTSQ